MISKNYLSQSPTRKQVYRFFIAFLFLITISNCSTPPQFVMVEKSELKSQYLEKTPQVTVYLPENYEKTENYYSVLYAHDGQNLFDQEQAFSYEWELDETLAELQKSGVIEDIIVVAVHNTPRRISDYTPSMLSNKWVNNEGGELTNYGRFLVEELIPYINSQYRTLTEPENTAVMGSSLGGLASFYLAGWYPEVFGKAAVISPSFWWDNVQVTNDISGMDFSPNLKMYIDGGYREGEDEASMIKYMRLVYSTMKNKGFEEIINLFYYEDPEGIHNEADWARRLHMPVTFLFSEHDPEIIGINGIYLHPEIIGVGDQSIISAEIQMTNNLLFTIYADGFDVNNKYLLFTNGTVTAMKEGTIPVIFTYKGFSLEKEIEIYPLSREFSRITINVTSPEPVESMTLNVYLENGTNTNYSYPLEMMSATEGTFQITGKTDEGIRFHIIDNTGRVAQKESGREIKKNLIFSPEDIIDIQIYEWDTE